MATYYVTVAGAGAKDGAAWATAFDLAAWETHAEGSAAAGDIYYVEEGTYTLTGGWNTSTQDGTSTSPIIVIGVVSGTSAEPPTKSDWADGATRPLIACGANEHQSGDYWNWYNFRFTTTHDYGFRYFTGGLAVNCYSNNSSASARDAIRLNGDNCRVFDCEAESGGAAKGNAIVFGATYCTAIGCYCHDANDGIVIENHWATVVFCILDTLDANGIECGAKDSHKLLNNTIYNCAKGIEASPTAYSMIVNNIISDCTTGISMSAERKSNYIDWNNYYNNTADVANCTKGENATAHEPQYTDAAGGDFSLNTASSCIGAAFSINDGVG